MSNPIEAFLVLAGLCFVAATVGGSFVFGVAIVCRWMAWAPINTTIIINNSGSEREKPL